MKEVGPSGKRRVKQRKQLWGGQAAIYQFHVSARLRPVSPSHSSLRPPCYEAIVWIFMKSDPYQQKTSSLRNLSPARLHYHSSVASLHLVLPHSAALLPLIYIALPCSLPLSPSQESIFNGFPQFFWTSLVFLPVEGARCDWSPQVCQQDAPAWGFRCLLPEIALWTVWGPHTVGLAQRQEHLTLCV